VNRPIPLTESPIFRPSSIFFYFFLSAQAFDKTDKLMPSVTSYLTTGAGYFEFTFVVPVDKKSLSNNAPGRIRSSSQSRVIFLHAISRRRPSGCSVTWYSSFPSSCALLRLWATKCLFVRTKRVFSGKREMSPRRRIRGGAAHEQASLERTSQRRNCRVAHPFANRKLQGRYVVLHAAT